MNLKKPIIFCSFLFLILFFSNTPNSKSYPGMGDDCSDYHMGKIIKVHYDSNAIIQLDGLPNEKFWQDYDDRESKTQINVSTMTADPETDPPEVTTLNMSFVRNDDYLFIYCEWEDQTTLPDERDGFYICWNINVPNFTAYYPSGMDTSHMGGGYIDSWTWYVENGNPINDSDEYCTDQSFGSTGDTGEHDEITVQLAYTTFIDSKYCIEICRKLTTADRTLDVQFDRTKKYEFNLGIINDTESPVDHAISYTHALYMTFSNSAAIPGFSIIPLIIGICFISIISIYYKKYNYKNK